MESLPVPICTDGPITTQWVQGIFWVSSYHGSIKLTHLKENVRIPGAIVESNRRRHSHLPRCCSSSHIDCISEMFLLEKTTQIKRDHSLHIYELWEWMEDQGEVNWGHLTVEWLQVDRDCKVSHRSCGSTAFSSSFDEWFVSILWFLQLKVYLLWRVKVVSTIKYCKFLPFRPLTIKQC